MSRGQIKLTLKNFSSRNLKYLFLSDLPGIKEKEKIVQAFKTSLPSLELKLDLK